MTRMVIIHKTPSVWNKIEWLEENYKGKSRINKNKIEWKSELQSLIDTDVYIQLSIKMKQILGIDELHIVQGYDPNEDRNWIVSEETGKHTLDNGITYWSINDVNNLHFFMDFELIFTRGNYINLHNKISKSHQISAEKIWLHYPATSVKFPYFNEYSDFVTSGLKKGNINLTQIDKNLEAMMIELKINKNRSHRSSMHDKIKYIEKQIRKSNKTIENPYTIVLCDDEKFSEQFSEIYNQNTILNFNKPCIKPNIKIKFYRDYDMTFCGTTLQDTKNHMLFAQLLDSLDNMISEPLRVAVAGDMGNKPSFSNSITKEFKNITVDKFGELSREDLYKLFNNSRSLIVLSGRDSNPRILQEAGICGSRVIVSDILSEGKELIAKNKMIGKVIKTVKESWFYQRNGNLKFQMTPQIANRISKELSRSYHPYTVSETCTKLYDIETTASKICEALENTLL
jgi:hypothetical protein